MALALATSVPRLGEMLLARAQIQPDELERALELQKERGDKLGKILVDMGFLAARDVLALHVTHEIADAFAIEAEVSVMRQGTIVAQGTAPAVLATERERLLHLLG